MNELKETKCASSGDICPTDSTQDTQRTTAEPPNQASHATAVQIDWLNKICALIITMISLNISYIMGNPCWVVCVLTNWFSNGTEYESKK